MSAHVLSRVVRSPAAAFQDAVTALTDPADPSFSRSTFGRTSVRSA